MTPLERADRVLALDDTISPGPYKKCGEDMVYWVENVIGQRIEEFEDRDRAIVFAEFRTLAPALARDVQAQSELIALMLPYAQHIPEVAEKARALGMMQEPPTVQELRESGIL